MGTEGSSALFPDYERDLDALLRNPAAALDRELNIYRSGSAPPTIAGARAAAALLSAEDEVRAHPDYLSFYYSNENLNPRMPPPVMTREDWRAAQRLRQPGGGGGGGGGGGSSLFSVQPVTATARRSAEWGAGGAADQRLGPRRKSFAETVKEDFGRATSIPGHISRPVSRNAFDNTLDPIRTSDVQLTQLQNDMDNINNIYSGATSNGLTRVQSFGSALSHSFASAVGSSVARSTTPDPLLVRRSPSPSIHGHALGGRLSDTDKKTMSNEFCSGMADCDDMANTLSSMKLSEKLTEDAQNFRHGPHEQSFIDHPDSLFNMSRNQSQYMQQSMSNKAQTESSRSTNSLKVYDDFSQRSSILNDIGLSSSTPNSQLNLPKRLPSSDVYRNAFSTNQGIPTTVNNQPDTGSLAGGAEGQYFNRNGNNAGSGFQAPITDPLYAQYLSRVSDSAAHAPVILDNPSVTRNYTGTSVMDLPAYQEAYLGALLAQQNLHYGSPFLGKSGSFNNGLYDNPPYSLGMPYPGQLSGSAFSSFGPGSPLRPNDRISRIPSISRGSTGGTKGSWNYENSITEGGFASSLLEELKNNKTRSFELSEIVGHVLEFSGDQYGSRFIQQKLETGSIEDKNSIFPEILPHARILMTDVFGNYVIQKFFEHGTQNQRNQLADQLIGHVLQLSLQMYGCRVIQKALEVVDVNQQTQMVAELDGSIMRCVRDQNGNHVIQKCIECVPQERIQFIISSFYGQVVSLSTHPYGCRVIQRVLEHCDDAQTQSIMMEEILQSVCTLAQDQYGNYVVQHVLQHGKQEERSAIVSKLAGQIVKMSQQKFASNVVEKCLTYGTPEERKFLIDEMVGTTDENEPLQAMMKDQFGNYVVQKVLETCDDQKLELIISRIRAHLNALKKYTYGKHIVARVEKLIATGERRIGMSANST